MHRRRGIKYMGAHKNIWVGGKVISKIFVL